MTREEIRIYIRYAGQRMKKREFIPSVGAVIVGLKIVHDRTIFKHDQHSYYSEYSR